MTTEEYIKEINHTYMTEGLKWLTYQETLDFINHLKYKVRDYERALESSCKCDDYDNAHGLDCIACKTLNKYKSLKEGWC